jgi:formylglycine-generating enzyme required for sulfatase activity
MDSFTADYLAQLTVSLTARVLGAVDKRVRETFVGTKEERALRRCIEVGIVALLTKASADAPGETALLQDIFTDFFDDPFVAHELSKLLLGVSPDQERLRSRFEQAGYDIETLPGLDFESGMAAFEAGFVEAAIAEPVLQDRVQRDELAEQSQLQKALLDEVSTLVKRVRAVESGRVGIQAGTITAENVVSGVQVIHRWWQRPYLHHLFATLGRVSIAGIDRKAAGGIEAFINLCTIYTSLLTLSPEENEWLQDKNGLPDLRQEAHRLSALAQLNRHDRLALLGSPGSGKSTFINFVALCLAGERLGREEANLERLTAPLPQDDGEPEPQLWSHGPLLPVHVVLRDFAARGLPTPEERGTAQHLCDFVTVELASANLGDYADHLWRHLREEGGLLLLDGLDEVPAADRRRAQIKQVVEDLAVAFPDCRILVTSRTYAYQQQAWRPSGFEETVLAPFEEGQIRDFIDRWYTHMAQVQRLSEENALGRAELLKRAIFASDRLQGIAQRPLLLTLIASLHAWRGGSLPEKREELYADAVDLLLDWWESQRMVRGIEGEVLLILPSLAEWLKVENRDKVRALLNRLAYEAHAEQAELVGTADVSREKLVGGLLEISKNPDIKPRRLEEYLSRRAGLLVPRGVGVYTFPHRTFQEYLAACHLTDYEYPDRVAELARDDPDRWREVALLAGAKSARGSDFALWALVEALCYQDLPQGEPPSEPDAWGALLAGQALVESADLDKVSERNRVKVERIQAHLVRVMEAGQLPAVERAEAGKALAVLGDERDFDELIDIPAGPFLMGSDPAQDQQAYDREQPQHEVTLPAYRIGKYPVTVGQFRHFVEASGYEPKDQRCLKGVANHPVVYVTWHDARAYCAWLTEVWRKAGKIGAEEEVRLPTEAEWEKAARGSALSGVEGTGGRIYPWGNGWDVAKCNTSEGGLGGTSPVGMYPAGASPYGCLDMAGNVWEWTISLWGKNWRTPEFKYPYTSDDGRENSGEVDDIRRVLRGGAYENEAKDTRCTHRISNYPYADGEVIGFRIVISTARSSNGQLPDKHSVTYKTASRQDVASYGLNIDLVPKKPCVGQYVQLNVSLSAFPVDEEAFNLLLNDVELYCFITADGLQIQGSEVIPLNGASQPDLSKPITFNLQAQLVGERPYTIELFAEDPESGHISIYKTSGTITVLPPQAVEEHTPILPPLDIRVAPQPDFVLNVETALPEGESGPRHLTYYLSSRLPGLHLRNEKVGEVTLRAADLTRLRALLQTTLQQTADCQTEDAHKCMRSLGTYLFDHLFPAETAADFREALWQAEGRLMTWLIREDGHTWLPWELVVPYRAEDNVPLRCLGERYQLSHWIEGLGPPLYNEVPLGEIALAHYNISEESAAGQDEALSAWHKLLHAPDVRGILPVIKPEMPFYGVHLLRWAESLTSRRDIVAREASTLPGSIERDTEQGRLHLRLKRPVVTLSILSGESAITNMNYDDWLLPDRVLPFLRAGASAVVGPWWPTSEAADRIFWPMFYDLLARRLPLGEVVWRARLAVRQALPDRLDWMAYTLFGDPRARAYWPEPSEGYTVLECLNPDDPLRPGKTYTFRVSLRSRPPVWYTDRLVQAETLPQALHALFLAPGLQTELTEPVPMTPVGRTMLQATVDLTPPAPGDYPLLAQLLEGDEHIKTLQLTLKVRDEVTEKVAYA